MTSSLVTTKLNARSEKALRLGRTGSVGSGVCGPLSAAGRREVGRGEAVSILVLES